jgi:hypothetical protein
VECQWLLRSGQIWDISLKKSWQLLVIGCEVWENRGVNYSKVWELDDYKRQFSLTERRKTTGKVRYRESVKHLGECSMVNYIHLDFRESSDRDRSEPQSLEDSA